MSLPKAGTPAWVRCLAGALACPVRAPHCPCSLCLGWWGGPRAQELAVALAAAVGGGDGDAAGEGEDAPRPAIYNVEALHDKLEDISWVEGAAWGEAQAVTAGEATRVENVDDDLERELAFYNQALAAAQEAVRRFEAAGAPWLRPPDYYAGACVSMGACVRACIRARGRMSRC